MGDNGHKYGTLSKLAWNVMAIQASTWVQKMFLVLEEKFSIPFIVFNVVVCIQNWHKWSPNLEIFYMEEYNKLEDDDIANKLFHELC